MKTAEHFKSYQPDEYQKAVSKDSLLLPLYRDLPGVVKKHIGNLTADDELQVVDFGCGPGTSTPQLFTLFQDHKAKIVGVDRDASCIELAKASGPQLNYQQIDESKLTDGSSDIIFCIFVLLEKESQEIIVSLLLELHRA